MSDMNRVCFLVRRVVDEAYLGLCIEALEKCIFKGKYITPDYLSNYNDPEIRDNLVGVISVSIDIRCQPLSVESLDDTQILEMTNFFLENGHLEM